MAKRQRELALKERRERKQAKKAARREGVVDEPVADELDPDAEVAADGEAVPEIEAAADGEPARAAETSSEE